MKIIEEENRLVAVENQEEIAEMTWVTSKEQVILINHTVAKDDQEKQKLRRRFVELLVKKARVKKQTIVPLCPHAKQEFQNNPDYHDVLKKSLYPAYQKN